MKNFVFHAGLAFIVSAFVIPIIILVIGWKKAGPSDGYGQLAAIAYAFWSGVGLVVCGLIILFISIFLND